MLLLKNHFEDVQCKIDNYTDSFSVDKLRSNLNEPTNIHWKKLGQIAQLNLITFQLKEPIEEYIPEMFHLRKNIYFFLVIWDYGTIFKIIPYKENSLMLKWELKFYEKNTRAIFTKQEVLLRNVELTGGLNFLIFLYLPKNKKENNYLALKKKIRNTTFFSVIQSLKKEPTTVFSYDLHWSVQQFISELTQYAKSQEGELLPLTGGCFTSLQEINERMENEFFNLQLNVK